MENTDVFAKLESDLQTAERWLARLDADPESTPAELRDARSECIRIGEMLDVLQGRSDR